MIKALHIDYNVPAKMRDGTILYANIFRPDVPGKYPVALTRTPYGKDYMTGFPYLDIIRLAKCGYIVIVQDVRGRGDSEGEWELFINESMDGYDSVEWASQLEGSNGNVGMWGFSYLSYAQWAAAILKPPHLKAIIPTFTSSDFLNGVYWRGGALELGILIHLLINSLGMETLFKQNASQPENIPQAINTFVNEVDNIPQGGLDSISMVDLNPIKNTGLGIDLLKDLVDHPLDDKYSKFPYSLHKRISEVDIPTLNIAGWNDIFLQNTINSFTIRQEKPSQNSSGQNKLLIGPWAHLNYSSMIGELDFGMASSMAFIDQQYDHVGLIQRWFDHWLKGEPNGVENDPPVKFFIGGEKTWLTDTDWPPQGILNIPYYFRSEGDLSLQPPKNNDSADTYTYDPYDPVATIGGAILMHPYFIPGPRDQHPKDNREDILRFLTAPLNKKLYAVGPVKVHLWASSSAPDTDFVATLIDVYPDGKAMNITDGITRAKFRNGNQPEYLEPSKSYEFIIDLWSIGHVFLEGHSIRVDITSSNFPRWDRNLNTKAENSLQKVQSAQQRILHDSQHPSRIVLPILPRE